jgi:hypothetical protein
VDSYPHNLTEEEKKIGNLWAEARGGSKHIYEESRVERPISRREKE